jgi:hypothetical protein
MTHTRATNESEKKKKGSNRKKEVRPKRHIIPDVATHRAKKPRFACKKNKAVCHNGHTENNKHIKQIATIQTGDPPMHATSHT